MNAAVDLFDRLIDPTLLIRRLNIVANHIIPEDTALQKKDRFTQLDLFTDYAAEEQKQKADAADLERERKLQEAVKDAVQSMTGIEVATVNLYIAGVSVPRTAKTAE
mgnify:CR=1 FL=1